MTALVAAAAMVVAGVAASQPAQAADQPWLTFSDTADGLFVRWTVPNAAVEAAAGGPVSQVVARGSFGPSDDWAQINLGRSGSNWTEIWGPLHPGLYHYQLTADDTKNFADVTNPNTNEIQPTWRWFYVPGPEGYFLNDAPEGTGGTLQDMTYHSAAADQDRTAVVWTPPGYDAGRSEPYPVFYLQHGAGQSYRDWTELGRAKQIFDNLVRAGDMEPMVVVMGNGNGVNFTSELLQNIVPASRAQFNVSDDPSQMALAGLSMGGSQSMAVLKSNPGAFGYVGSFGFGFGSTTGVDATAVNAGTTLLRFYVGNVTDVAYNSVMTSLPALDAAGIAYEFDGINPDYGHNWNHWSESLNDFAQRLFRDPSTIANHGMSQGHLPATAPFTTEPTGTTPTPWVTDDGFVVFEAPAEYSGASTVTVWGNWGASHRWTRIEMSKSNGRWRATVGALEPGLYYYRLHVDRVQMKDTNNPTSVTSEPNWSTFFVPGDSARLLADAPAGEGGDLQVMPYDSTASGNPVRSAYVWTPPGYDPDRAEPYPVLYLQHGSGQNWTDWVEMGRAKQILDNLYLDGTLVPMVVVMGSGNGVNFTTELVDRIVPTSRAQFNVSEESSQMAIAGLSMGGSQTVAVLKAHPGMFAYVGSFAFGFGAGSGVDVDAINAGTTLLRFYSGNITDTTYNSVMSGLATMDSLGVEYEFNGVTEHGHNWDAWQQNLIDFLPRLFKPAVEGIPLLAEVPEPENGWLALTVADYGGGVALAKAGNVGDRLHFVGELPAVTVTDSRTAAQAAGGGWAVSGQSSAFSSADGELGADHLGWAPRVDTPKPGLVAGSAIDTVFDGGPGLAVPAQLASANAEGRFGAAQLGASLAFDTPVDAAPGTYTGVLTVSLFPVD